MFYVCVKCKMFYEKDVTDEIKEKYEKIIELKNVMTV